MPGKPLSKMNQRDASSVHPGYDIGRVAGHTITVISSDSDNDAHRDGTRRLNFPGRSRLFCINRSRPG
jgi:hypothetical protein